MTHPYMIMFASALLGWILVEVVTAFTKVPFGYGINLMAALAGALFSGAFVL